MSAERRMEDDAAVPPTQVIDLREAATCGRCAEPLAIAAYDYNGDPSALLCSDCAALVGAAVAGAAATTVADRSSSVPLFTAG
jgi:hypothetical protein